MLFNKKDLTLLEGNKYMVTETSEEFILPVWAYFAPDGSIKSKFKYMEGSPRQYRFDAKKGTFNINGTEELGDKLTFQPIAWRIFQDNILNMGPKKWAELFFIDDKNCVSSILFHEYSVDNILRLIEPLFYDDLALSDVVLTVVAEKKENNKIQPKGIYYIANFGFKQADPVQTEILKAFANDARIWRKETYTKLAIYEVNQNYWIPEADRDAVALPAAPLS